MTHMRSDLRSPDPVEVMVWISNTDAYPNWSEERKLMRLERVMEWHAYVSDLHDQGKVTHVWGSHQLLSRSEFTTSQGVLLAVYRTNSWQEFDILLAQDPLREVSQYNTSPLCSILNDRDEDLSRYHRHQAVYMGTAPDELRDEVYARERARYNLAPEYVGKYPYKNPKNPKTPMVTPHRPGDPMQFLILGVNPPEYITMWDDLRKLIHHEKVTWWHDYVAMLIDQGKISHGWSTNDFCSIRGGKENACGPILVYCVQTFAEFNQLYKMDPLRDATVFWSVLLQPIADQRKLDQLRLDAARQRENVATIEQRRPMYAAKRKVVS